MIRRCSAFSKRWGLLQSTSKGSSLSLYIKCLRSEHHRSVQTEHSFRSLPPPPNNKDPLILSSIGIVSKHRILANPRIAPSSKFLKEYISRASEVGAHFLPKTVTIILCKGIYVMGSFFKCCYRRILERCWSSCPLSHLIWENYYTAIQQEGRTSDIRWVATVRPWILFSDVTELMQ